MNMVIPPRYERESGIFPALFSSFVELSDKRLPTPIENASTKIRTTPARTIVLTGSPAAATPDNSPTVETRLSSTPNTKLRNSDSIFSLVILMNTFSLYALNERTKCAIEFYVVEYIRMNFEPGHFDPEGTRSTFDPLITLPRYGSSLFW